jgi:uncharacterized protein YndB with AHSA1/START domain
MSEVRLKIGIDAPMDRVWEVVMDPTRLSEWVTIHRSVRDISDQPLRRGSTMQQVLHIRGVSFHVHWKVVEAEPPNRAEWDGRGPAHSRARIVYQLSGGGEETTTFEYTNEFTPPGGRLGNVASRMIVRDASEREARNSLSRLKALLERG